MPSFHVLGIIISLNENYFRFWPI